MKHTKGPWTLEIEEYEACSGTITIPEINRAQAERTLREVGESEEVSQ